MKITLDVVRRVLEAACEVGPPGPWMLLPEAAEDVMGQIEQEEIDSSCDCSGCDTCGMHCVLGCGSGQGEPCTVKFKCPDPAGPDCHDDRCERHYGEM